MRPRWTLPISFVLLAGAAAATPPVSIPTPVPRAAPEAAAESATPDATLATPEAASAPGRFTVRQYEESDGIRDGDRYAGATIFHPADATGPLPSVIIVPGYMAAERTIQDWGPFYASHGIVTMTIGTNRGRDGVALRADALLDAKASLIAEQTRAGSPLRGRLDVDRIAVSGWSMGGGGAQIAATRDATLKAVVALCPWDDPRRPGSGTYDHAVPVLIFGGSRDGTAPFARHGLRQYEGTPDDTPKLAFEVRDRGHWVANGPSGGNGPGAAAGDWAVGRIALAWLKVHLEADDRYRHLLLVAPSSAARYETNLGVPYRARFDDDGDGVMSPGEIAAYERSLEREASTVFMSAAAYRELLDASVLDGDVTPEQRDELLAIHASLQRRIDAGEISPREARRRLAGESRRVMGWARPPA